MAFHAPSEQGAHLFHAFFKLLLTDSARKREILMCDIRQKDFAPGKSLEAGPNMAIVRKFSRSKKGLASCTGLELCANSTQLLAALCDSAPSMPRQRIINY